MKGLSGRIAVVTGATGLLGGSITRRMAAEGATVVVASRRLRKAQSWIAEYAGDYADRLVPLEFDLADEGSITAAFDQLADQVGVPTVLIANASLRDGLEVPFAQLSREQFNRIFDIDVAGHFLCARHLVQRLAAGTPCSIVFLSSVYAVAGVDHSIYPADMAPAPPQYAAAKSAVLGLTRYLAGLWGEQGVRVNAVIAGGVHSPGRQASEFVNNYLRKTMLKRFASAEEIASVVAFLASEEASYLTGECLVADGGLSAW